MIHGVKPEGRILSYIMIDEEGVLTMEARGHGSGEAQAVSDTKF